MSIGILILILISSFSVAGFIIFSLAKKKTLSETTKIWWNFIKKNKTFFLKALAGIGAIIGAIIVGEEVIKRIKKALKGKVDEPVHFIPSPYNPNAILLETDEGKFEEVELPEGTTISAVVRGEEVIIAHHDTVIREHDHVLLFVPHKTQIPAVEALFRVSATFV